MVHGFVVVIHQATRRIYLYNEHFSFVVVPTVQINKLAQRAIHLCLSNLPRLQLLVDIIQTMNILFGASQVFQSNNINEVQ